MKFQSAAIAALICAVTATPVPIALPYEAIRVEARQDGTDTSNDLTNGLCRKVTLIYARGSTESGNMVSLEPHSLQVRWRLTSAGWSRWAYIVYQPSVYSWCIQCCLPGSGIAIRRNYRR